MRKIRLLLIVLTISNSVYTQELRINNVRKSQLRPVFSIIDVWIGVKLVNGKSYNFVDKSLTYSPILDFNFKSSFDNLYFADIGWCFGKYENKKETYYGVNFALGYRINRSKTQKIYKHPSIKFYYFYNHRNSCQIDFGCDLKIPKGNHYYPIFIRPAIGLNNISNKQGLVFSIEISINRIFWGIHYG